MIGKLKCWWKQKHVRGKYVRAEDNGRVKFFACPRCGRETSYKAPASSMPPFVGLGQQGVE